MPERKDTLPPPAQDSEGKTHRTRDTGFAAWLEWEKNLTVMPTPKIRGKASFVILGIDDEGAAHLWKEFQATPYCEYERRKRTLTLRIPEDYPEDEGSPRPIRGPRTSR